MSKRDYYDVLGADRNADEKTLKSAYRKLAMKYHPDRNPDDPEAEQKFKELNEAYDVLKDSDKRAAYNQYGHAAFEGGHGGHGGAGFGNDFHSSMSDIFDDLFGDFMGGGRRRQNSQQRGSDLRYNLEISLADAFKGKSIEIDVATSVQCNTCKGSGTRAGTSPTSCRTCNGVGKVRTTQGFFTVERTCPSCHGAGQTIEDPCPECRGQGLKEENKTLSVNIPIGVDDGMRIRLAGEGDTGRNGGATGDLYIFVSVQPHDIFRREGADLFCTVPISMAEAALGGDFEVPALDGTRAKVKVPEGTQTGKQFRLRGKGMPVLQSKQVGDLYVQAKVETPQNLSARQKELLREFSEISSDKNSPHSSGFFSRLKEFFDD